MSETPRLNVAQDESAIYEGGELTIIFKKDLLGNEAAIAQLCNAHNICLRENSHLRARIEVFEKEKIVKRFFPYANAALSIVNVLGVLLLGFGLNYMSQPKPPAFCGVLLWVGAVVSICASATQPFVPMLTKLISR